MDNKEILRKNKEQHRSGLDEREKRVYHFSFGLGAVVIGVMCLVFSICKALRHEPFYEYAAMLTAYLCTTLLYQFKNLKRTHYLVVGLLTGVVALACSVMFFLV